MKYEKGSFIVVPSRQDLLGLSPIAQCLFMWLCAFANEDGESFPSRMTLAKQVNCSTDSIDIALNRLIKRGLIKKTNRVKNGENLTSIYTVEIMDGSRLERQPSRLDPQGVADTVGKELNPVLTQSTYTSETAFRVIKDSVNEDKPKKEKSDLGYRKVFELWGDYPLQWRKNRTEIESAKNLLVESDIENMKWILSLYEKYKKDPYCPTILKPSDMDRKWDNLLAFRKKYEQAKR